MKTRQNLRMVLIALATLVTLGISVQPVIGQTPPATANAKYVSMAMSIDGRLNEAVWPLSNSVTKCVMGTCNNTVTFGALWDNTYLYVGIKVLDGSLRNDSAYAWDDDSVEVYIDPTHNHATPYDSFDRQFIKGYKDSSLFSKGSAAGVLHAWAPISGGYTVELAIPWANLGVTPTAGLTMGFDVGYNDDDSGGGRDGQAMWNGTANNWQNTSAFGHVKLMPPDTVQATYVNTPMKVDGKLNEADWFLSNDITKCVMGTCNNTATFGLLWDNTYLYVGAKVLDGSLRNDSAYVWDDDSVEVYIDPSHNHGTPYDSLDRQFIKGYNDSGLFSKGSAAGVLHASAPIFGGYTVELAIPWTNLGLTPTVGRTIGFDVGYNDDDNGGGRDGQAMWKGTADNWQSTSAFGHATLVLPRSPRLYSAISAHGNTDWHIDTANEFLFGVDMQNTDTAANHCPDSWSRRHMYVDLTGTDSTSAYYYDRSLTPTGADTDSKRGIETAMLFFYAGHGNPVLWNTLGDNAEQRYLLLGNYRDGGLLRYYWQCSCEVFAHGPLSCSNTTEAYGCPEKFNGADDSNDMRNVYQRWGPALTPDLRMACGASTLAYCHEDQANRIWDDYNNKSFDVADSFIDGLHGGWASSVVPLCITRGGSDVTKTPLYDTTFTNLPNTSGTSHYHIQYLENFAATPSPSAVSAAPPAVLPVVKVKPLALPAPLREMKFETKGQSLFSTHEIGERGPRVRVDRSSGALYVRGESKHAVQVAALAESDYIDRALRFVEEQGWMEKSLAKPVGGRLMIESIPVGGNQHEAQRLQKNVIVTFNRQIDVDGVPVEVLGASGLSVQMNNDGSVLNASKVWREVVDVKQRLRVKKYEEAYGEALEQLDNPQAYTLRHWRWGYKEAAGNVEQSDLRVVFRFKFAPADGDTLRYPPRLIEIAGQAE